jgi:glycosyltransferase 2 family protein
VRVTWQKTALAVLVLAALTALAYRSLSSVHIQGFSWARFVRTFGETRVSLLLISLAAVYAAYMLRALRWKRFSRALGPTAFAKVYSAVLMGFAALFLLGRVAEPIPPLLLARKTHLPASSMFGIYILERLFDLASTAVMAGLGLLLFPGFLSDAGADQTWERRFRATGGMLLIGLVVSIAFLAYFHLHGAEMIRRRLMDVRRSTPLRRYLATQFGNFSAGLQAVRTLPDLLAAVAYSALHWVLLVLVFLLVVRSFGGRLADFDFASAMLLLAVTMIGSTVQLPGVGGGAQVASFIALTRIFKMGGEAAAAIAVILWLVAFAAPCLAGVPLLIKEGWSIGSLRGLARSEAQQEEAATP